MISDSAYELSYICALTLLSMPLAAFVPVRNDYASSKLKWLKILTQRFLIVNEIYRMNDGQPFSEMTWLTSSYTYNFMCTFSLQ